jgi:sec-independent protein translocase protein TatA
MVGLSVPEVVLIGVIALVVFGPKKLPEVGSALGKTINEFKKSMKEVEDEPTERKPVALEQRETPKQLDAPVAKPKEAETPH